MPLPTNLTEKVNVKAVNYLLTVLDDDMWIHAYSQDEDVDKKMSLARTQKYLKAVAKSNGMFKATYKKSIYDKKGLCRSYGDGIQGVPSAIRGVLCDGLMTDVDIVNCFPNILSHICEKHNIPCPNLNYYCENRNKLIKEGKVNSKIDVMICINTSTEFKTSSQFMMLLDAEIKTIQKLLINEDIYKIKDNMNPKCKNFNGTYMTNLLMSFEAQILECVYSFLVSKKYQICAFMFDGLMVYGDFKECEELEQEVFKQLGMDNIKFTTKPHSQQIKVPDDFKFESADEMYKNMKLEQEQVFKLSFVKSNVSYSYLIDGKIMFYDKTQMSQILNTFTINDKKFFEMWLDDDERKTYEKVDIIPNDREVPENVLNLWTGFAIEKVQGNIVPIDEILEHIKILCGRNDEYYKFFMKWLANFFQFPSHTSVMPFIQGVEGCGKGVFIQLLRSLIGEDKFFTCEDMKNELMGQFNGHLRDVMLVNIDEIDFKTANEFVERIKSMITRTSLSVNEKREKRLTIPHYIKYITTANPKCPFHISENDRRIAPVSSSPELKGNDEYFKKFTKMIDDKNVQYSFYKYLMEYETKEQIQGSDIPETELRQDAKILSRDSIEDFIAEFTGTCSSNDFFSQYKQFMTRSNLQCNISLKTFQMKAKGYFEKYGVMVKDIDRKNIRGRFYYVGEFDESVLDDISDSKK